MPTFLATRRMPPALAARIGASVRGNSHATGEARKSNWTPRPRALARIGGVLAIGLAVSLVPALRRHDRREFERSRAALVDKARAARAILIPEDEVAVGSVESWLKRSSGAYEGDFVSDELQSKGALATVLARPAVYLRGTQAQLSREGGIAEAAAASLKDPLLVCLVDPPGSRAESALLARVRDAYSSQAEQRSLLVVRFREAQIGLPFLLAAWTDRVWSVRSAEELDSLREAFDKAPINGAVRAAKARLLIFGIDEPGEAGGPTELDGERPHAVRVGLVDLSSRKVLFRMRRRVDPAWISAAKRPLYASGLDGCALAFDLRDGIGR